MAEDENTSQKSLSSATSEVPWPAYSEAFEVQTNVNDDKNYVFLCKLCIGKKFIHASKSSSANLKKHLHVSIIFINIICSYIFIFCFWKNISKGYIIILVCDSKQISCCCQEIVKIYELSWL